uniref:FAD:protein FMN transferase n=1 Tax=Ningiella ruwaisensis TaxID=2364274 RepID=UPI0014471B9D|nr:FAD:protein FMN transferase [Ningiella ruwaisensis]
MKHDGLKNFSLAILLICSLALTACAPSHEKVHSLTGKTMGTTFNVKFVADGSAAELDKDLLLSDIETRLLEINQLMSTYIEDSELSRLNKAPANTAFTISDETAYVIEEALRLTRLSDGALDITVGPIVNLWGFGPDLKPETVPTETQVAQARALVGPDKFTLQNNQVIKAHQDVYIDLSTIAKGYAVDELAEMLEQRNITNYLVEIGGEMRLSGQKPEAQDWLVAIEKPVSSERAVQRIIHIGDNAIASSGDYRNYVEEAGRRFSHLIDPQTAYPIDHNLVSVSVIAPTCIEADGLATALIVMGFEKGMDLAEREGIAALFITKEGNEFVEYRSNAFSRSVKIMQ